MTEFPIQHSRLLPPSTTRLNHSVAFLAHASSDNSPVLLLDRLEFSLADVGGQSAIFDKIIESLDLSQFGRTIGCDEFIDLLSEQFAACSEYIYGNPLWRDIREGSKPALRSYILETRHYLAAAASRMAPSIGQGIGLSPLVLLLSQHLLEEWDHAKFFSEALQEMGCSGILSTNVRPLPATLEWIHLTRSIGFKHGLNAAVCSGFMEYSSREKAAVKSWHSMLVESGLLSASANKSIFRHFETDLLFAHSDNWETAIKAFGPITASMAIDIINDVTIISEMIYRWLSALRDGLSSSIVVGMSIMTDEQILTNPEPGHNSLNVLIFDGLPAMPSSILEAVNWGDHVRDTTTDTLIGLTYGFGHAKHRFSPTDSSFSSLLDDFVGRIIQSPDTDLSNSASLDYLVGTWLRSIDGHALWDAMIRPSASYLVVGYMLENFHYLASASRHIGAAISACTDTTIRLQLISHFEDELSHCNILREKLMEVGKLKCPENMRPLPTTVAFVGFLEILARQDWRAYIVASHFLQKSLSANREQDRQYLFYERVNQNNPETSSLLDTFRHHDDIDDELGHDGRSLERLKELIRCGGILPRSVSYASVSAQLAWSFLDGILRHYTHGNRSILQRQGWWSSAI